MLIYFDDEEIFEALTNVKSAIELCKANLAEPENREMVSKRSSQAAKVLRDVEETLQIYLTYDEEKKAFKVGKMKVGDPVVELYNRLKENRKK